MFIVDRIIKREKEEEECEKVFYFILFFLPNDHDD
jgi:hypothetical protein